MTGNITINNVSVPEETGVNAPVVARKTEGEKFRDSIIMEGKTNLALHWNDGIYLAQRVDELIAAEREACAIIADKEFYNDNAIAQAIRDRSNL